MIMQILASACFFLIPHSKKCYLTDLVFKTLY